MDPGGTVKLCRDLTRAVITACRSRDRETRHQQRWPVHPDHSHPIGRDRRSRPIGWLRSGWKFALLWTILESYLLKHSTPIMRLSSSSIAGYFSRTSCRVPWLFGHDRCHPPPPLSKDGPVCIRSGGGPGVGAPQNRACKRRSSGRCPPITDRYGDRNTLQKTGNLTHIDTRITPGLPVITMLLILCFTLLGLTAAERTRYDG